MFNSVHILPPGSISAGEIEVWERMCLSAPFLQSPFLSPSFVRAVSLVRPHVYTAIFYRNGSPVGFLPFQYRTGVHSLLRTAEPAGEYMAGYFGLVAEPGFRTTPEDLLRACGLTYLHVTYLEESQSCFGLSAQRWTLGNLIRLEEGTGTYWTQINQRNRKLPAEMRRRERQLENECGPLLFCFNEPDWKKHLAHLIDFKRRQYQKTGQTDQFAQTWKERLLYVLAGDPRPSCTPVLSTLYAGNTWVASHFGLRNGGVLNYYFPVYNPELSRYSPGHLLLKRIIDSAPETGLTQIDRGAGDTRAKRDFANAVHRLYSGAWFRPGIRSLMYRAGCSIGWRLSSVRQVNASKAYKTIGVSSGA